MVPPEPPRAETEIISELDSLTYLVDEWRALAVARGNAFVTPEWLMSWHRHFGEGHELVVCAVRSDGELRGVLPLVIDAKKRPRTARFAGSAMGDFFHPAARIGDEADVAAAAAAALHARPAPRTGVLLENVEAEAAWWTEFAKVDGSAPVVSRESVLPSAHLDGRSWEEYLGSRSRNLRSQVGRRLRALERDHEITFRWTRSCEQVADDMNTLFRLHGARWNEKPGRSAIEGGSVRAFHADFARAAQREGWLRLCLLEADGAAVAGWYGWRIGNRFAYYQAGFDPAWGDRSVGFVLFAQTIRAAIEEGATAYDMLLGDEPFKLRFADSTREVRTLVSARPWSAARMLAANEARLRRAAARLPEGVREPLKRWGRVPLSRLPASRRH